MENNVINTAIGLIEEQMTPPWSYEPELQSPEDEQEYGVVLNSLFDHYFKKG
jgi:hypothetical protein